VRIAGLWGKLRLADKLPGSNILLEIAEVLRKPRIIFSHMEEIAMSETGIPKWYVYTKEKHKNYIAAVEQLDEARE